MKKIFCIIQFILMMGSSLFAQTQITGKVTDSKSGAPLSGVTVRMKESNITVQTKDDGTFQIPVSGKQRTLVFSSIGYASEELNVGNKNNVSISLTTEERKLQEVVVIAYGSQDKRKITGSVAKVDGKEFENVPMASVDQMLQGKVAGVQSVSPSGQPGGAQEVRIRGIGFDQRIFRTPLCY